MYVMALLHEAVFMNAGSYVIIPKSVGVDLDLAQVAGLDRLVLDRDFVGLAGAIVGDAQRIGGHGSLLSEMRWNCMSAMRYTIL